MKIKENSLKNHDRRTFIKKVLKGTISGSLLLVIPAGADVGKPGGNKGVVPEMPQQSDSGQARRND